MARTLDDLYNFYLYVVRKERGVFVLPAQFTANMDAAQIDCLEEWFAPYGETQTLHDALRPLRVYQPFTSDSGGFVNYPSNYIHALGNPFSVYGSTVTVIKQVQEDEFPFAVTSQLRSVSNANPINVDSATGFSIFPQAFQTGAYWYLRRPATPVYGYSQAGRVITYVASTSTQIEFTEPYLNHILARGLWYAGVNMSEQGIEKFAQEYNAATKE